MTVPAFPAEAPASRAIRKRPAIVKQVLQSIDRGHCCRLLGPRYRFKSDVLHETVTTLEKSRFYHVIYLKVSELAASSEAVFFHSAWQRIVDSFAAETLLASTVEEIGKALDFQHALLQLAANSRKNLVLVIDDLEMIPPNLGALLLGVLRTVFLTRTDTTGARFQAVVGGSLSLSQVALENASGFESVSDLVVVGDLDEAEREALAHAFCREQEIVPEPEALDYLLQQTGGDPFLIEEVLKLACRQPQPQLENRLCRRDVEQAVAQFLEKEPYRVLLTELRHIETDTDLLASCLLLLEQGTVPGNRLPSDIERSPSAVELCGAFEAVGDSYRIKPGIWLETLQKHFQPSHVGGRYVIVGDWARAITYLGTAVAEGGYKIRVELYAAVINAINASLYVEQAFEYLLAGLRALYPSNGPQLYQIQGNELHPVGHEATAVSMHDTGRSEIVSFEGPEYSMSMVEGESRLLVPLRVGSRASRALGLVSLLPLDGPSPHERRDEIKQLVSFLHQASRAIFSRMELARTAQRAEQLRALNGVLTIMLHHRSAPVDTLLRLALTGVTHGWGLGFNRAVLFQPDASGQMLVGTLAIGHLSHEEADVEWKEHPYDQESLDGWLSALSNSLQQQGEHHRSLEEQIGRMALPLHPATAHQLARSFHDRRPFLGQHSAAMQLLPRPVLEVLRPPAPFALVPLHTGERVLGVLYVDDKFAPASLSAERFELLQTFVTQAALIVENVRAIAEAQKQEKNVRRLREQHFTLISGLVHELSTSMAGVRSLIGEIQQEALEGRPIDEPMIDLESKTQAMDEISARVRHFNMSPFQPKPHPLQPVIQRALAAVQNHCPPHVDIEFHPPEVDPPIYIDQSWLELLFRNLLQNAFQAIPDGQPGLIAIETQVEPSWIRVVVTDNGQGITTEMIDHIFELGMSTKEKHGQSFFRGMGLFYCQQVAQEHNGSLRVTSQPGVGTTFILELPRQSQELFAV